MPEGARIRIQGAVRLAVGVAGMLWSFVSGNPLGFVVEWDDAAAGTDELLTGQPHEARLFTLGKKATSLATDDPTLQELGGASLQLGLGAGSSIWTGRQVQKEGAGSTARRLTGPGIDEPLVSLQDITRSGGSTLFEEFSVSPGARVNALVPSASGGKSYIVYVFRTSEGRIVYVGRASGAGTPAEVLSARLSKGHEHYAPGLTPEVISAHSSKLASQGAEEFFIVGFKDIAPKIIRDRHEHA